MQSFGPPRPTMNPYLVQLSEAVSDAVDLRYFSWPRALFGGIDVVHMHWPELLMRRPARWQRAIRRSLFLLLLLRIRIQRIALVRTLHNAEPHVSGPRTEQWLLRLCDRWVTLWIRLQTHTPTPRTGESVVIPLGHYIDWLAGRDAPHPVPERIVFFGHIRAYKGIESLLHAFEGLDRPEATLHIVGLPEEPALADAITAASRRDPRISASLEYVDENALLRTVGEADIVVLPFRDFDNSSSVLLALSLGRRLLVPATPVTSDLVREVGPEWVHTYDGPLDTDTLAEALERARPGDTGRLPTMRGRDWASIGDAHVAAYERARATARR
jgi:beta-1,4-mannosyltransferase